jgi:hypothetical protein
VGRRPVTPPSTLVKPATFLDRSIEEPVRRDLSWPERFQGPDRGLIFSWERGRELASDGDSSPFLGSATVEPPANNAKRGELPWLPWRIGTLYYLAMWQGLRGDDLHIPLNRAVILTCAKTRKRVRFCWHIRDGAEALAAGWREDPTAQQTLW